MSRSALRWGAFLAGGVAGLLLWGDVLSSRPIEGKSPVPSVRPNILWISAEDLSPDLGAYGDPYAITPTLDRFAAEGARYTQAISVAPVCAPSRSSIITGMYPTTIGSMHMRSKAVPPVGVRAFTEWLREAGYYCTNRSKTDYNFEPPPAHRPPDTLWDETGTRAHWRHRPDPAQPFFSVVNLTVTHESQIRADEATFARQTAALRPGQRHDPARAVLPPYYPDTPLVRKDWARYHDLVTALDFQVAEILAELEADGLAESTIVFFWGDHGRGLPRAKRWIYDSGILVPLMVRWPGRIAPGTVIEDLVTLMDLGPTVLSLAGVPVPSHMQGRPFLGAQAGPPRTYQVAHRDRMDEAHDTIRAVRDRRYKYIRNFFPGRPAAQHIAYLEEMPTMQEWRRLYKDHYNANGPNYGRALNPVQLFHFLPEKPREELYDLTRDPHEIENLADSPRHAVTLRRMRAILTRWQRETGDLGLVPETQLRERMRPGGVWQQVEPPTVQVLPPSSAGTSLWRVTSKTPGATFAYTFESGPHPRWRFSTGQIEGPSQSTLRVKACRLGFLESEIVTFPAG